MAAVAQATAHTHFIYYFQPPEGKVCTTGENYEFNSRVVNRSQEGITHKPCKTGLSVPAIKTDKVLKSVLAAERRKRERRKTMDGLAFLFYLPRIRGFHAGYVSSDKRRKYNGETMTDEEIIAELKREPAAELRRLQRMPYEWKVEHALDVIREFVEHEGVNGVYVSFSGGKDSLVLLHLVRSIYPNVPAVFANTGIEFPEQVKFVRSFPNVTEVHPIKHFPKIIKEDGIVYPSKEVAMYVKDANKGCRYAINGFKGLDTEGKENRYKQRFKRWAYLLECGVKISPVCCELMKERPMRDYEKKNGKSPIIGTRAEESFRRAIGWMKSGCNSFAGNRAKSTPLSLWLQSDVMRYIDENGIKLSPMYTEGGMNRTGCMFCPVPIAHGDSRNIEYSRTHHPKMYETMMIKHGLKAMLYKVRNTNGQMNLFSEDKQ